MLTYTMKPSEEQNTDLYKETKYKILTYTRKPSEEQNTDLYKETK